MIRKIPFVFLALILSFSSCAYQLEETVPEKRTLYYHNIQSVLVVPFINHTPNQDLNLRVTEAFTLEVGRFQEVSIVHYNTIYQYLLENQIMITEENLFDVGKHLAEVFGVEAIILGAVTEFDPYYPPVLGVSFEVIEMKSEESILSVSETFDANFSYVRESVRRFVAYKNTEYDAFGDELVLQKTDDYIRFVCFDLIKRHL